MKITIISIIVAMFLIGGAFFFSRNATNTAVHIPQNNVSIVNGTQIVDVTAKGGYLPRKSTAKAGIPTIVRFNTNGTFDCSASVRIPSMDISSTLPASGVTEINIGVHEAGILNGTCGMGMYPFEIEFTS